MNDHQEKQPMDLPSGIFIYPSQEKAIDQMLTLFIQRCPAEFVLLAEMSGQIISVLGVRNTSDLAALGSLVAGDLAASKEIARLTGQNQNFHLIMREGPQADSFIAETGPHLVLFAQVKRGVPLGWARLLILETCQNIVKIVSSHPEEVDRLDLDLSTSNLADLVDGELKSLWNN